MNDTNNINGGVQPTNPTPQPNVNPIDTSVNQNVQPIATPTVEQPVQNVVNPTVNQVVETPQNSMVDSTTENVDPMNAVANLNKDEAMEEALSHTNQYTPFEATKQEVNQEVKKTNNKSAYVFIGIIFAIMLLFIIFLPQISNLFGWV